MKLQNKDSDAMTQYLGRMLQGRCPVCARSEDLCDLWYRLRRAAFSVPESRALLIARHHAPKCIVDACDDFDAGGGCGMCSLHERRRKAGRIDREGRMVKHAKS